MLVAKDRSRGMESRLPATWLARKDSVFTSPRVLSAFYTSGRREGKKVSKNLCALWAEGWGGGGSQRSAGRDGRPCGAPAGGGRNPRIGGPRAEGGGRICAEPPAD